MCVFHMSDPKPTKLSLVIWEHWRVILHGQEIAPWWWEMVERDGMSLIPVFLHFPENMKETRNGVRKLGKEKMIRTHLKKEEIRCRWGNPSDEKQNSGGHGQSVLPRKVTTSRHTDNFWQEIHSLGSVSLSCRNLRSHWRALGSRKFGVSKETHLHHCYGLDW